MEGLSMKAYGRLLILGLVILGTSACEEDNKLMGDGGTQACKIDSDCIDGNQNICNTGVAEPVCVACLPDRAGACVGTTPVCGGTTCVACKSHSDCKASDVCLPDGSCAAETAVVYLNSTGSTNPQSTCTKMAPCASLGTALTQAGSARPYIRVDGTISNAENSVVGKTLTFYGAAGAVLKGAGGGGGGAQAILTLTNNANVEINDVSLMDSREEGIIVSSGSRVTLVRSKVDNAAKEGIVANGKVTLLQSEVTSCNDMARRGINVGTSGDLTVNQSRISDNNGGGIIVQDNGKFTITNSFIVGNKVGGGLSASAPDNASKLEFNTIVDNVSGNGGLQAGGVICGNTNVSARYNILYRNTGGTGGTVQKLGDCVFIGSFEMAAAPADDTLKFKSDTATAKDYHLTAASPTTVQNVGTAVCTGLKDYDGDDRPLGGACDLGADEIK
jgi:Right handed beta helix region